MYVYASGRQSSECESPWISLGIAQSHGQIYHRNVAGPKSAMNTIEVMVIIYARFEEHHQITMCIISAFNQPIYIANIERQRTRWKWKLCIERLPKWHPLNGIDKVKHCNHVCVVHMAHRNSIYYLIWHLICVFLRYIAAHSIAMAYGL